MQHQRLALTDRPLHQPRMIRRFMAYEEVLECAVTEPPWIWIYPDEWNAAPQLFPAEKRADSDSEQMDLSDMGSSRLSDAAVQDSDGGCSMMDEKTVDRRREWHEEMQSSHTSARAAQLAFWKNVGPG